jgi:hypothetical protein
MKYQLRTETRKYAAHAFIVQNIGDQGNDLGAAAKAKQFLLDLEYLNLATLDQQQAQRMMPGNLPA